MIVVWMKMTIMMMMTTTMMRMLMCDDDDDDDLLLHNCLFLFLLFSTLNGIKISALFLLRQI